jgi:hypothetical protein
VQPLQSNASECLKAYKLSSLVSHPIIVSSRSRVPIKDIHKHSSLGKKDITFKITTISFFSKKRKNS